MELSLRPPSPDTITGATLDLRSGRRTCVEVLETCLARIDARESPIRAWVVVDRERAHDQAVQLDRARAGGAPCGPLFGIPIGVKDIVDVAGLPTACGARRWADRLAEVDAPIVARLRQAGAVIVGKTVTTPYAWIDPPPTRNPWNLQRTPGGSSSGSAAALACGMILGAVGSQTGGSITRPASFCGVCGLKPTFGRLPTEGILPFAPSLDHPGPMARTVADLEVLWLVLAEAGPREPCAIGDDVSTPRLGRLRGLFDERADPAMRNAFEQALDTLQRAGCTVVETSLPTDFDSVIAQHRVIMSCEAAAFHEESLRLHPDDYPERITSLIEEGLGRSSVAYVRAKQHQVAMSKAILSCLVDADLLVSPAAVGPAPGPETTGDPLFNSPWSYLGLPTVTFPTGLSSEGLPLGIQLIGRPFEERKLLRIAAWCEAMLPIPNGTESRDG